MKLLCAVGVSSEALFFNVQSRIQAMKMSFTGFATIIIAFAMCCAFGCNGTPQPAPMTQDTHGDSAHPEEGPHHGHLIELGQEEYHAELTHEDATKTVTLYLLDKAAKNAVSISDTEVVLNLVVDGKPLQVKLAAAPLEGEPAGQSSRFTIVDEAVLEALEAPKTTGRLNVSIKGKSYIGKVEHHDHDEKK